MALREEERGAGFLILVLILLGLGLTASVLTVSVRLALDEQATLETQQRMRRLAEAVSSAQFPSGATMPRHFEQDVGQLPSSLSDLLSRPVAIGTCYLTTGASGLGGWCGPYWSTEYSGGDPFSDGWNNSLILGTSPRQIRSRGPNGVDDAGAADDLVQTY